jgi:chromosome segregation ATPase
MDLKGRKKMPSISKIRLTNVVYEEGLKRYNDEIFRFDGHNGAILLENGGGKTVFIQTVLQAILPHVDVADRKIKNTLLLENSPAHIAIEWIMNDEPRRYVVTAVSLFMTNNGLDSLRYVYEYSANDPNGIEGIPFVREGKDGKRPAERGEMQDYYGHMKEKSFLARTFNTIKEYKTFIEEQYHIISSEWESIVKINSSEGGVEAFFDECKSTNQLFDRLLIPTVESSIVGHDANLFADMFEKQHTSFKHYKKLKETIEENKLIQQELEKYVQTYEQLHKSELTYLKAKQRAKGAWLETLKQKQFCEDERTDIWNKLEEWKNSYDTHNRKSASYEILVEETLWNEFDHEYKISLARREEKEEELTQQERDYHSLRLAELKQQRKEHVDRLAYIEDEMKNLDQTEELTYYEDELETAQRALLGCFMEQLDAIEKEEQGLKYELNPIEVRLEQLNKEKEEWRGKERNARDELSRIKSRIESRTNDLEKLKQQLLANPSQEHVKEEIEKWIERQQWLDEEIIRLQQEVKQFNQEEKEAEARKEAYQHDLSSTKIEQENTAYQLKEIQQEEQTLIKKLASLRPQWATLESVHANEATIEMRLIEQIEKRTKERNTLLVRERLAYRFVDDYSEQGTFFGDPFLEQQLKSWKNQFDYLVTGVEYLQSLAEAECVKKKAFPLWPITLITTAKSKERLIQKIKQVNDRLQFPIAVISTEEAVYIHDQQFQHYWIEPRHWDEVIDPTSFHTWKERIKTSAKETTKLREEKEDEIKVWREVYQEFKRFIQVHPYEKVENLQKKHAQLARQIEQLTMTIQKEKERIDELRMKISNNHSLAHLYREEMRGLEAKIEKGMQYLQYEKEVEEDRKNEKQWQERLAAIERELKRVETHIRDVIEQKAALDDRIKSLQQKQHYIMENHEYRSLRSLQPIYSGESEHVIREKIRELEYKIRKIQTTYGEWKAKHESEKREIDRLTKEINELKQEHMDLDEARLFPSDGRQLLQMLKATITSLKTELRHLNNDVQSKLVRAERQKGKWESKLGQFQKDYPNQEIFQFTESLDEIKAELQKEKEDLDKRKAFLDQEKERIEKTMRSIEEAERSLERFVEGHHFNAPHIAALPLSPEEKMEFTYHRQRFIKAITNELQIGKKAVEEMKSHVERAKRLFRDFCHHSIKDVKMRQMALNGIEHKETYEDIIDFKKNMMRSVESATNYANEHIRQKDAELQTFINHIHSHLRTVVEELRQIPKKTRVKVGDDWKQIFTFSIPEWEEEVGKTRIRDYIEWILQQLESDRFMNEHGRQDDGKVRKEIEMWLQTKQLLQVVMNNEAMKVNCRKVTNDNKVTTRSYSWEQSNLWSGGEKWSKNMTLFLGILNYVAEKKQHIQPNMKRHRAVILDNPFGKASSDHVLSPVFFIAEQLGFQIIALTAHAEGKFLRDYFPIIYSCRLRPSSDANKKVMTKERWLHYAYFQDHEPKTLDRLGEVEQLELF